MAMVLKLIVALFILPVQGEISNLRLKNSFPCPLQRIPADQFCVDATFRCCEWAANNECLINPAYMKKVCCASCRNLQQPMLACLDLHPLCRSWASYGQCHENSEYMKNACPISCNHCINGRFPPSFTRDYSFFPKGTTLRHVFNG